MAAPSNLSLQLAIQAAVSGLDRVNALVSEIDGLGGSAGEAGAKAAALGERIDQLGAQRAAIDTFQRLDQQTRDTAAALDAAQQRAQELGRQMAATESPSKRLTDQFERARQVVDQLDQQYVSQNAQLNAARAAMTAAGLSATDLDRSQRQVAAQTNAVSRELERQVGALTEVRDAARATAEAQARAAAEEEAAAQRLTAAYHTLGLRTPQELEAIAAAAREAFGALEASGTASYQDLQTAATRYAEAARAAHGGVLPAIDEERVALYGVGDAADAAARAQAELAAQAEAQAQAAADAWHRLGLQLPAELEQAARQARADFELIESSGNASYEQLQAAAQRYAEAARAAHGGVLPAIDEERVALYGVGDAADAAARAQAELAAQAEAAARAQTEVGESIRRALTEGEESYRRLGVTSRSELERTAQQAKADFERIERAGDLSYQELQQAARKYAEVARAAHGGVLPAAEAERLAVYQVGEEFQRAGQEAQEATSQTEAGVAKVGTALRALAGVAAAVGVAELADGFLGVADSFERLELRLETLEGSAAAAQSAMGWVTDFAAVTPYQLNAVTEAFVKLRGYGIDPTSGALRTLGDMSAAMGKDLDQAVEALADAMTGEYERLKEFGIRASQVGDEVKFRYVQNGQEMEKAADASSASMIESTLLAIWNDKYQGQMEKLSTSWAGMTSNLADLWTRWQNEVMDSEAFDALKQELADLLAEANRLAADGTLKEWAEEAGSAIASLIRTGADLTRWLIDHQGVIVEVAKAYGVYRIATSDLAKTVVGLGGSVKDLSGWLRSAPWETFVSGAAGATAQTGKMQAALTGLKAVGGMVAFELGYMLGERLRDELKGTFTFLQTETERLAASIQASTAQSGRVGQELKDRLAELSKQLGISIPDMATFNKLVADGEIIADEAAGRWRRVGDSLDFTAEVAKAVRDFTELAKKSGDAGQALASVVDGFDLSHVTDLAALLKKVGEQGAATGEQIESALMARLDKMNNDQLQVFQEQTRLAFERGSIGAAQMGQMLDSSLGVELKRVGLDLDDFRTGVDQATRQSIDGFQLISFNARANGEMLSGAFEKALETVGNTKEVEALRRSLEDAGRAGKISLGDVQKMAGELEKKAKEVADTVDKDLAAAFERAGVQSRDQLQATAEQAEEDYKKIADSGKVSADGLVVAAGHWRDAAEAAGDAAGLAAADAALEQAKLEAQTDKVTTAADRAKEALAGIDSALAGAQTKGQLEDLQTQLRQLYDAGTISAEQYREKSAEIDKKLKDLQETGEDVESVLSRIGKAIDTSDSIADLQGLEDELRSLAIQGQITDEELMAGLDRINQKQAEITNALGQALNASVDAWGELSAAAQNAYLALDGGTQQVKSYGDELEHTAEQARAMGDAVHVSADQVASSSGRLAQAQQGLAYAVADQATAASRLYQQLLALDGASDSVLASAEQALRGFGLLDDTQLSGIKSQIDRLRASTDGLRDSIQSTVDDLRDELDRMAGDQAAIEQRDYERRRADILAQQASAKAARDQEAIDAADEALQLLDQLHAERLGQIEAEQQAAEQQRRDEQQAAQQQAAEQQSATAAEQARVKALEAQQVQALQNLNSAVSAALGSAASPSDLTDAYDAAAEEVRRYYEDLIASGGAAPSTPYAPEIQSAGPSYGSGSSAGPSPYQSGGTIQTTQTTQVAVIRFEAPGASAEIPVDGYVDVEYLAQQVVDVIRRSGGIVAMPL